MRISFLQGVYTISESNHSYTFLFHEELHLAVLVRYCKGKNILISDEGKYKVISLISEIYSQIYSLK